MATIGRSHRDGSANLIPDQVAQCLVTQVDPPPSEPLKIGEPGMRADADTAFRSRLHGPRHDIRVTGMHATCDIG